MFPAKTQKRRQDNPAQCTAAAMKWSAACISPDFFDLEEGEEKPEEPEPAAPAAPAAPAEPEEPEEPAAPAEPEEPEEEEEEEVNTDRLATLSGSLKICVPK